MNRLVAASVFTLVALFGLLFALIVGVLYVTGAVSLALALILVVVFQLFLFFISPFFMDLLLRWMYKAQAYSVEEFMSVDPSMAKTIREVARQYNFRPPRIYLINDEHPTAFCYGINRSHARIVVSHGIITYLDENERAAVVAHELGHIVHRDFIVMTLASIVVQIFYIIAESLLRQKRSSERGKNADAAVIIGIVSYVLYWIANLILLWLSRVREYYADEFAAKTISPSALASALLKVAYGITSAPGEPRLIKRTGALGIMDTKNAKQGVFLKKFMEEDPDVFERILAFDLYSPWAKLAEITSTHPLTGKRIARLLKMEDPGFHVGKPNMERMYAKFVADASVWAAPFVLPVVGCIATVLAGFHPFSIVGGILVGLGLGILIRTFYAYPSGDAEKKTVLELMCNPYTSPVRGMPVEIEGKVIGRGVAGYKLSEDFVVDDGTGIVYIDFKALIPGIGELFFALKEVKRILGQEGRFRGWFFRGIMASIVLKEGEAGGEIIHSHPRTPGIILSIMLLGIGMLLFV